MASEAVVTFVVGKLGELLIQEARLLNEVQGQFEWIETELKRMQCYLKDADSKLKADEKAKNLMKEIREVSYDAEDVIDTYIQSKTVQRRRRGFERRVRKYVCIIDELRTRHDVAQQIERIKLKIKEIPISRGTYGIQEQRPEGSSSTTSLQERRRYSALLQESEVVGLQDETKTLSEQLVNGEVRRCVISIVGMGGSGKTALARKVYHDVKAVFDCHAFIYLSEEYVMKDVVIRIIECVMRPSRREEEVLNEVELMKKFRDYLEVLNEVELMKKLRDYLKDKRYLVVVDDIWSKEAWDDLEFMLPDTGQSKSRVMLTTRSKNVAVHADPVSPLHEMRLLNDDVGWELFMKKVFPGENPTAACPSELEEKGREIFAKCRGLPLAILALGGLLAEKEKTFREWSKISEGVTSSSDECLEILDLSYQDLPHHLKPCFLYFGLFPTDYEIHAGRLIRLWIAEGFIQQRESETKKLEDFAEEYLEELVGRNMIQVASKRSNGSIRTCRIHDSFHELSISEAMENNFFIIHKNEGATLSFSTSMRRLALHRRYELKENHSTSPVRSILCFPDSRVFLLELLKVSGKLLRVVDANWAELAGVALTKDVGDFVHLRYLELRHSKITEPNLYSPKKNKNKTVECLPSSIGNLSKLQTLRLSYNGNLPDTISNLEQLRHLKADGELPDGQPKLNTLTNLQTLGLRAGSWIEDGLAKLTNLRKLGISGDLRSHHKALSDSIKKFFCLQSLKLRDGGSIPQLPFTCHHLHLYKMYLDGSIQKLPEWPPNLAELTLRNSKLEQDAISALEKLQNLKILRLYPESYDSKEMICSPRGFLKLEMLVLDHLPIEKWIVKERAMPSIKSVKLIDMSDLKTLPEQVGVLKRESFLKEEKSRASETGRKPGQ
ncbi:putative disease resistance protein [Cinnamomum micranthum f. kanehirae]|uniref:Putative disease resistance protein n=1 Tax=Cinnamomum micranthum f. kanehirae TaxID=337451 RepID=A0A3S3QH09_9MAGN|nr:putative disease resistance protein [Cinnamomum micranthum f. kanehirae]